MFASSSYRSRRASGRTATRWVVLVVAALAIVGLVLGLLLWWYANSRLHEIDVPALDELPAGADAGTLTESLNVLVVGNSSREGLTEEQLLALGTEDDGSRLTDTIMVVHIAPAREKAVVVSFPRDLKVAYEGDDVKVNSLQARGGPDALVTAIQDLSGLDLDHYVQVDMAGFLQLADVLGGVEVCLDDPLVDEPAGVDLPSGCQPLTSTQALGFVRSRSTTTEQFGAGDFGRIAKQQYYLQQAMSQATQLGTLANPLRVKQLIDAVATSVTTDRQLGLTDMYRIANTLKAVTADDVVLRTVPGTIQTIDGESFVVHDPGPTTDLFEALRTGTVLADDVGTATPAELGPPDVKVLIVNGVGIEGLAANMETFLTDRDFQVTEALNPADLDPDEDFDTALTRLTIRYLPDHLAQAELLRDRLGDVPLDLVEVAPDDLRGAERDAHVVLVVGSAWDDRS